MSKRTGKKDDRQLPLDLRFGEQAVSHITAKEVLLASIGSDPPVVLTMETYEEACVEIAVSVKQAIREYGNRIQVKDIRPHMVQKINEFYGVPANRSDARKVPANSKMPLSIHMFNHYLSKPIEYPFPAPLLFAIHHITGSLGPCQTLVSAEGGEVIYSEELKLLQLGRAEAAVVELNKAKRELKKGLVR